MGGRSAKHPVSPARLTILLAVVALAALLPARSALAAEGLLDPTFGSGGFTILDEPALTSEYLGDVVVLPDGKILAGGSRGSSEGFLLARFNPDGSPDTTFGPEGFRVEPDLHHAGDPRAINDLAMLGDGRIVAAGLGRGPDPDQFNAFGIARYLPSGQLDPGFGDEGLSVLFPEGPGEGTDMDIAPGGKIVVAGERINLFHSEVAVLRLTPEGNPDPSFAAVAPVGFRIIKVPGSESAEAEAVRVLGDGSVVVGGGSEQGAFLAKLDSDGEPVASFGTAGFKVQDLGEEPEPSGEITDLAIQPDGRIVVTGSAIPSAGAKSELIVARFTAGGQLDPSFGSGGIFRLDATGGYDEGRAMSLLPDGRILVAGLDHGLDTWLLRLTPDGRLDPGFGTGGQTVVSASPTVDTAEGLAVQPDGRPVIAGWADSASGGVSELLVGRFTGPETVKVSAIPTRERCGGRTATIVGTGGVDRLKGTKRADVITGLGGNDRISALAGNDIVCGGNGKDTIDLGKGRDEARGEGGRDTLRGGPGKDKLVGGAGRDVCNGGAGKDASAAGCETRKQLP